MRAPSGRLALLLAALACVSACAPARSPGSWLATYGLEADPRPAAFDLCRSFGCTAKASVGIDAAAWERVQGLFSPAPGDAREERAAAARAVGLLEEILGPQAGTEHDVARNDPGPPGPGQLDCLAEASNTTVYLLLLERDGLLPRHRVGHPAQRGFLVFFAHSTAVLVERAGGRAWAVDSWFLENGRPAGVWPLEIWRARREAESNRENRGRD